MDKRAIESQIAPVVPRASLPITMVLNGFPKSGLHFAELMAQCVFEPFMYRNWVGTFGGHSFTNEWLGLERLIALLEWQTLGSYSKGHIGYREEIVDLLRETTTFMVFIFRDFRDVAVSQLHHIMNKSPQLAHPNKELYWNMGSDEERLLAIIEGVEELPGLFERWELYAGWLEVGNVLPMPYELMRNHPDMAAEVFIRFVAGSAIAVHGLTSALVRQTLLEEVDFMVEHMGKTQLSATYRKGVVGGWRGDFTPKVKDAFKAHAGDWLIRLGYEQDHNW